MSPPNFSPGLLADHKSLGAIRTDDLFVEASIKKIVHPLFIREHWEDGKIVRKEHATIEVGRYRASNPSGILSS